MKEIGIVLAILVLLYVIWQAYELQQFRITRYEIENSKINHAMRIVLLADLHCHTFGKNNERLLRAIRKEKPDVILIPGDLIMDKHPEKYEFAADFIRSIADICPIYFSRGNNESRVSDYPVSENGKRYMKVEKEMKEAGCHILSNSHVTTIIRGNPLMIYGLELDRGFYTKGVKIHMRPENMTERLGECDTTECNLLLAHNPAFSEQYAQWGADLTVCGHNHGGLICIPGIGSIISPQFEFFPKYSFGQFDIDEHQVIISRGLGTHTFHIRIFNRAEIVTIDMKPDLKHKP